MTQAARTRMNESPRRLRMPDLSTRRISQRCDGGSGEAHKRGRGKKVPAADKRSERAEKKRRGGSGETGEARSFRRRRRQCEHRYQDVAEAKHKQPHKPESAKDQVGERDGAMIGQEARFFIDCKRDSEGDHQNQRRQCGPAIGANHRKTARAAQIVGQKSAEQQQAGGSHDGSRNENARSVPYTCRRPAQSCPVQ